LAFRHSKLGLFIYLIKNHLMLFDSVGYYPSTHCAPSLLIGFINMFMMKSRNVGFVNVTDTCKDDVSKCEEYPQCNLSAFYPGQVSFLCQKQCVCVYFTNLNIKFVLRIK
jgi:hypothetical protein